MTADLAVIDDRHTPAPAAATPFAMDNPVFNPDQFAAMAQVAAIMATAKLVPEHLQNSKGDCFLVVEQARRWNMSPFAVAQETYSIKGKLLFGGKLVTAVINARAPIDAPLRFEAVKVDGEDGVRASGTFKGENEPRTYEISINKARSVAGNSSLWKTDPFQQACYFAARFWARRHCPEVILGVWSEDEIKPAHFGPDDARDVTPAAPVSVLDEALAELDEASDPETGEIAQPAEPPALEWKGAAIDPDSPRPLPISANADRAEWKAWCQTVGGILDVSANGAAWLAMLKPQLASLETVAPKWADALRAKVEA